jgi:hypothetical protein
MFAEFFLRKKGLYGNPLLKVALQLLVLEEPNLDFTQALFLLLSLSLIG